MRTDRGETLLADNHDTLHDGSTGVVDAVEHRLNSKQSAS